MGYQKFADAHPDGGDDISSLSSFSGAAPVDETSTVDASPTVDESASISGNSSFSRQKSVGEDTQSDDTPDAFERASTLAKVAKAANVPDSAPAEHPATPPRAAQDRTEGCESSCAPPSGQPAALTSAGTGCSIALASHHQQPALSEGLPHSAARLLLAWGAEHGYPPLPLKAGVSIAAGETRWLAFVSCAPRELLALAVARAAPRTHVQADATHSASDHRGDIDSMLTWIRKHHCLLVTTQSDEGCAGLEMLFATILEGRACIWIDNTGALQYVTSSQDDPAIPAVHGHSRLLRLLFSNLRGRRCTAEGCYSLATADGYVTCQEHHLPATADGTCTSPHVDGDHQRDPSLTHTPINRHDVNEGVA